MSISHRIALGRKKLGLTTQEFANRCGVSRGAVQHWEAGLTAPNRSHQAAVAKLLGMTVAELMNTEAFDLMTDDEYQALEVTLESLAKIIEGIPQSKRDAVVALLAMLVRSPADHRQIAQSIAPLLPIDKKAKK